MVDLRLGDIKETPPAFVRKRMEKAAKEAQFYPKKYDGLMEEIAEVNGLGYDNILLTNGTDGSIDLIAKTFAQRIVYFAPTYYEFKAVAERNRIPFTEKQTHETDRWYARTYIDLYPGRAVVYCMPPQHEKFHMGYVSDEDLEEGTVMFLCTPNNPFGTLAAPCFWPIFEKSKGIVAVDEAYFNFKNTTAMGYVEDFTNLLVMRSFSKDFGLAGLRIGYIAGNPKLIDELREHKVFFDVSNVSVEGAKAAFEKPHYFKRRLDNLYDRKERMETLMEDKGLPVVHTNTNNILLHFDSKEKADRFFEYLNESEIKVNQGSGISTVGLDESWIRMACGTKAQMDVVEKIIRDYSI